MIVLEYSTKHKLTHIITHTNFTYPMFVISWINVIRKDHGLIPELYGKGDFL